MAPVGYTPMTWSGERRGRLQDVRQELRGVLAVLNANGPADFAPRPAIDDAAPARFNSPMSCWFEVRVLQRRADGVTAVLRRTCVFTEQRVVEAGRAGRTGTVPKPRQTTRRL